MPHIDSPPSSPGLDSLKASYVHELQALSGDDLTNVVADDVRNKEKSKAAWRAKYIWDTLDKPPKERWFLFKLDAILLTLASLGYFIKNLDQSNITSAYVSGMKEDLGMFGNQYNTAVSLWTVGYVIDKLTSGHSDEVPPPHLEKTLSTHISLKTQPFLFRSSESYFLY